MEPVVFQSFVANTDLMAKVLGIFQQMFSRDSAELDELIVDQMGYMVMVGPAGGPVWAPIPKDSIDSRSSTLAQSYWLDDNEYEGVSVNSGSNQVYQQIMKVFSTALCGVTAGTASVASGPGELVLNVHVFLGHQLFFLHILTEKKTVH